MKTIKAILSIAVVVILVPALMFSISCKKKDSTAPAGITTYLVQPNGNLNGSSYSAWSAKWWKWVMELPMTGNPPVDSLPFDITRGQTGNVWFINGPFAPTVRNCNIPAGTALVVGIISAEASTLEGLGTTAAQQLAWADSAANCIINVFASIDGVTIANLNSYRFASPQFNFNAPTPWVFGATGGSGTSVGDGYYLMFQPLPAGKHTIHYGGTFHFTVANFGFNADYPVDMTYNLTVQ